jgi:hypothetical protein
LYWAPGLRAKNADLVESASLERLSQPIRKANETLGFKRLVDRMRGRPAANAKRDHYPLTSSDWRAGIAECTPWHRAAELFNRLIDAAILDRLNTPGSSSIK